MVQSAMSKAQFAFRKGSSSTEEDMKVDEELVEIFSKHNISVSELLHYFDDDIVVPYHKQAQSLMTEISRLFHARRSNQFNNLLSSVDTEIIHESKTV